MASEPVVVRAARHPDRFWPVPERLAFGALLVGTAALYLWNLSASGWANSFYSAAAQAGSTNWTAMLFGSSDAGNAITIDKTPAALWVIDVSVRLFGLNPWSVLVPQALEGVAAVAVVYAAIRRVSGTGAALLAAAVLALTPVAALMFRFNNPDALLVLMLVAAAYCVQRACESDASRWWLVAAGAAVGVGFLAKMLQALLVLPGFAGAYLVAGPGRLRRRLWTGLCAVLTLVVSAGWYLMLVELWPKSGRPYIGGSQHNSVVELALAYNGFGRLTGDEPGGLGNLNHDVGWARLFGAGMGDGVAWLLPAALICLIAGLVITWREPRANLARAALIVWGGWLIVTAAVFSFMNGIVHPYYTVALAPAIAACIGIGATLLWQRRFEPWAATALAGCTLVSTTLAVVLLSRHADWNPWLRSVVAVGGFAAAVLMLLTGRLLTGRLANWVAGLALVVSLSAPAAYSVVTAATPHTGAIPSVGPSRHFGPPGGFGGPNGLLAAPTVGPELRELLASGADGYTWMAAVVGSNNAAGYQLACGAPVMAIGGFNGTDNWPTLAAFQSFVGDGRVHFFIGGRHPVGRRTGAGGGNNAASDISGWVKTHYTPSTIDGAVVYDLSGSPPVNR